MSDDTNAPHDALDSEAADEGIGSLDDAIIPGKRAHTRVIGLGGSAGGIQALRRFFGAMPSNSGMSFVVVLHLAPEYVSSLSEVLQKTTTMAVQEATDGCEVLPDHVYVIPPGKDLSLTDGHLRLTPLQRERGKRLTVDLFFRSLAETHGSRAVAVVLSGADGDGALGLKRIKELGGLTIAQDPDEAEHSGMPRAAIATRMVDWILRVEQIPERLRRYYEGESRLQLPSESGPNPTVAADRPAPTDEAALREVLILLRTRTGRDFSYYKRATIVRRIARRMQVNEVDHLVGYLDCLRIHPGEAGALLQDLLISVTNFFRDAEAFAALLEQIPELFRDKTSSDTVRVWVPACATGEEAYSIGILLSEYARTLDAPPALQIFATDLDEDVLLEARNGLYAFSIANDVSPERLQRFFVKEHRGYRVRRELREIVLFAVHDLLKDPPFSRLDLISCRNLLIYLNRAAQRRAFDIFHFALRPEGKLFLGTSESLDESGQAFQVIDKKQRIYASRAIPRGTPAIPGGDSMLARSLASKDSDAGASLARKGLVAIATSLPGVRSPGLEHYSWSELHLKLIESLAPPSLIVNEGSDILHLSGSASIFLAFSAGEPSTNLFRAIHPALRVELRAALFRAKQNGEASVTEPVTIDLGEGARSFVTRVSPARELASDLYLITIEPQDDRQPEAARPTTRDEPLVQHLERELDHVKQHWRDIVEQHEASTEELKASNEELQAMNEELRSATEELETSREELQSINEELTTVNQELKNNVDELGHANSDLRNLMGATAIATVFLDRELRIMRFTPSAVELFSLILTDVGRPLAHLSHQLAYPELIPDAARVLEHLVPIEREVKEASGRFFLARLLPYRTGEDRIAGVVLTFVDVTELQIAREAVRRAQLELERRVLERTAELDDVNQALQTEVTMHRLAEKARQDLQTRLVTAQEEERRRISRELHDEVGQQITTLMLAMKALETDASVEQLPAQLRSLRGIAEQVGREIHQLASELRPIALDELGLSRALTGYLDAWGERSGINVDFVDVDPHAVRLPSALETTLYRVVQEAMNNVFKHASAKSVSVSIERRPDSVVAIVEDDGSGFDPEAAQHRDPSRIGIASMRERAAIAGGSLTIESSAGGGTTVRVVLPLPRA